MASSSRAVESSSKDQSICSVFVKNLCSSMDKEAVEFIFGSFGKIVHCSVPVYETGTCKGFGFVHYNTEEAATEAVKFLNGSQLSGKTIIARHCVSIEERERQLEEIARFFKNVYVQNFRRDLTVEELRAMFDKFGTIASAIIMCDEDGNSKGFGFVAYEEHESAKAAIEEMNGKQVAGGRILHVSRALNKNEHLQELKLRYQDNNLYVKNLEPFVDDDSLRIAFSRFGNIISTRVMMHEGKSKEFGFVCFSSAEEAAAAAEAMNGQTVWSRPLYVALAQSKEERKAQLTAAYMKKNVCLQCSHCNPSTSAEGAEEAGPSHAPPTYPVESVINPEDLGVAAASAAVTSTEFLSLPGPSTAPTFYEGEHESEAVEPVYNNNGISFVLNSNVRNVPKKLLDAVNAAVPAATSPLDEQEIMRMKLVYHIMSKYPNVKLAFKITGMLLEIDNDELSAIMNDKDLLESKIQEAVASLQVDPTLVHTHVRDE